MRAGLVRIGSNYARLLTTLALGLIVVPYLIGWLGEIVYGLIAFLGSSVGVAAFFRELTHRSMIRELGAAYHTGDDEHFKTTYNSSFLVSGAVAILTLLSFGVLLALFPVFNIPDELRAGAAGFLMWQASHAVLIVLFSPAFNMYLVQHRFVSYNSWYVLIRSGNLFSAIMLSKVLGVEGDPAPLAFYGFVWATLDNVVLLVAVGILMARDRRLLIRPRLMSLSSLRAILGTFGWNTGVQASMQAIEKAPHFILNIMVGPIANSIWGVVFRLTSYVRMVTVGVQFGSDSVSVKLASGEDQEAASLRIRRFLATQTKLNATVALPAGLLMFMLAEPLLRAWVGGKLQDPEAIMGDMVFMMRVLAIAIVTRAVSEGWVMVLYGAGYVSRYAPVIFAGGVLAPVLGVTLTWLLPEDLRMQGPALAFMIVLSSIYLLGLPVVGSRCIGQSALKILAPALRPLGAATVAFPALLVGPWSADMLGEGFLGDAVAPAAAFGAVYAPLVFVFVLGPNERRRILGVISRRRGRRDTPEQSAP